MLEQVLQALEELRSPFALQESDLHTAVEQKLTEASLPWQHECVIGKHCRIDFLVGTVGIEIKKGRPSPAGLAEQIRRYAECEKLESLVVLTERAVRLPDMLCGKPVRIVCLNRNWGVALP